MALVKKYCAYCGALLESGCDCVNGKRGRKPVFEKPSVNEVEEFCKINNLECVKANQFCDYYESKGWVVGRVPMRDWRASARNWNERAKGYGSGVSQGNNTELERLTGAMGVTL